MFVRAGAARTPTLFVSSALLGTDTSLVDDVRVRTLYPAWEYASLQAAVASARTPAGAVLLQNLARQVAQLAAMIRGGGTVITGTDSPIDHTAVSTHMNLRGMVAYGLTPYEALTTATRNAGTVLAEPVGVIMPGAYADLNVLGGDPLADITQAANVRQVMANGRMFTVSELLAPFAAPTSSPTSSPVSNAMLEPVPDHPDNQAYWWHDAHYVADSRNSCCQG
jgi:hypothetical protein